MNKQELEQKYIHLFEITEDGIPVRGIEVGQGWYKIIEKLLSKIEWIRTHNTHVENPNFDEEKDFDRDSGNTPFIPGPNNKIKIFQIKEKFGYLRCYISVEGRDCAKNQVNEAIAFCEGQAEFTCENCGKVGEHTPTKRGWIRILCEDCKE